jgi:hypothetical protein
MKILPLKSEMVTSVIDLLSDLSVFSIGEMVIEELAGLGDTLNKFFGEAILPLQSIA